MSYMQCAVCGYMFGVVGNTYFSCKCTSDALSVKEGKKNDQGKLPYHLLAPEAIEGTLRILDFGQRKYAPRNWEKGMAWSRVFGALMRHMWAWWRGEDKDPETGESHLHHAACCIHFLQAYEARGVGEDDRPNKKAIPEKEDGWKDCDKPVDMTHLGANAANTSWLLQARDTYDPYEEARKALGYKGDLK